MDISVVRRGESLVLTAPDGRAETIPPGRIAARVADLDGPDTRWVWPDTATVYPLMLRAGVRVGRCVDLRLCHAILRHSVFSECSALARADDSPWDERLLPADEAPTLLDGLAGVDDVTAEETAAEHARQLEALAGADRPGRLRLLLAAESAGALVATEMRHVGMPWDAAVHDRLLTDLLGPRPPEGARPQVLQELVEQIRTALRAPGLNPDSQPALLRALRSAGVEVRSTRQWELEEIDHPAVGALLRYKKLARLLSANGWHWLDTWVHDGRFHPDYVPAGVVTGRWATSGGGALQLPRQVRAAVVADPGWRLVVADAAQLEPRTLAAMSGDEAMARAGRGADLYQGLVDEGIVATRPQAKVAMLAALYGATTGEGGALMPALLRAYPQATGVVEHAAREGERGHRVHTWLGRTSPLPGERWRAVQDRAAQPDATPADERAARRQARDWGRFTRNFVVQGTAAEWSLCWLAGIRRDLAALGSPDRRPDLVYFLHDEVMVHAPAEHAEAAAAIVRGAAADAGRLLFGAFPVEFPIDLHVVDTYDQAKGDQAKGDPAKGAQAKGAQANG